MPNCRLLIVACGLIAMPIACHLWWRSSPSPLNERQPVVTERAGNQSPDRSGQTNRPGRSPEDTNGNQADNPAIGGRAMRNTAPSPDESKPAYEAIPGDTLLKESRLLSERWRDDVSGCRERTAIIRADSFKHPLLRVVERWSRDGNKMISRNVMVADHIMLAPSGAADQPRLEKLLADAGFTIRDREP